MHSASSQKNADGQIQGLKSESIPLFNVNKPQSIINKYSINWLDVIIITFVMTIYQLIFKSWFVFEAFIITEYHITFEFLSWGLAILQITAFPTIFMVPYLNKYKCNYLCIFLGLTGMLCTILNSLLSGSIFNIFIVSFIRTLMSQMFWTLGNSIVFHFIQETDGEKKWKKNTATTIFMGSWTFSTILFLATGPSIDYYGFKTTMIMVACLNSVAICLLFYKMPAISLNDFIEIEHALQNKNNPNANANPPQSESGFTGSKLCSDMIILCKDIVFIIIMLNTLAAVTNWGMYYGSFGFWLQELFDLDASQLGIYVTICEAIAETISLCAIPILSRYISNSKLCVIGGLCETSSVIMLNVLLYNGGEILNYYILALDIEWLKVAIVLLVIFFFYMGHEFLYISLMVNIDIVPKQTHNTAVALYGCFDFTGAFIGQTFVTYVFAKDGMDAMAPIMLFVEMVSVPCIIAMTVIFWKRKKNEIAEKLANEENSIGSAQVKESIVKGLLEK